MAIGSAVQQGKFVCVYNEKESCFLANLGRSWDIREAQ